MINFVNKYYTTVIMSSDSGHFDLRGYIIKLNPGEFQTTFSTEEQCLAILADWKWRDGFTCRKCGSKNSGKGKKLFSRRCTRCKTEESATAHTIFHHCRMGLPKAFEIAYLTCTLPQIPATRLSQLLETREMTCLNFKKRILECVNSGGDLVHT